MRTKYVTLGLAAMLFISTSYALQDNPQNLQVERERTAKQYIFDLQNADYKDIVQLFEKNGFVISTSRGKVDAREFFYDFLPNVVSAKTELHQFFTSSLYANRLAARFHFSFKLKDGAEGSGEYMDEFVFVANSAKLVSVYMFENLKFDNKN